MKRLHCLLSLAVLFFLAPACKKDDQSSPSPSIAGYWTGTYIGQPPSSGYSMLFRTNGTVRVYNNSDTSEGQPAEGTYSVKDSTVTTICTYLAAGSNGPSFGTMGAWSNVNNSIKGTEGVGNQVTGAGTYSLTRQ